MLDSYGPFLEWARQVNADFGSWLTFLSITNAVVIAVIGWIIQGRQYRKRATFDLLIKLEESEYHQGTREAFRKIRGEIDNIVVAVESGTCPDDVSRNLLKVDAYLDIIELISELIHRDQIIFSVFYSQWGGRFCKDIRAAKPYIDYLRRLEDRPNIWIWAEALAVRIERRKKYDNAVAKCVGMFSFGRSYTNEP